MCFHQALSQMGLAGRIPKRAVALDVRRNDRVFPTLGLTDGAVFRFQSAQLWVALLDVNRCWGLQGRSGQRRWQRWIR